jgi:hypothetical protein
MSSHRMQAVYDMDEEGRLSVRAWLCKSCSMVATYPEEADKMNRQSCEGILHSREPHHVTQIRDLNREVRGSQLWGNIWMSAFIVLAVVMFIVR